MPAAVAVLPNVPVLSVGTWAASTGVFAVTTEDLHAAVGAFDDPGYHRPYLKLGHTDPRFNVGVDDDGVPLDGQPALGRLINPRVTADGMTLVVDIAGMPAWLAEIAPTAYPTRSIEAEFRHTTQTGTTHRFALTGLALLGATPPAVSTLADIPALFGLDLATNIAADPEPTPVAAAAETLEEPMPNPASQPMAVAASVNLDTVRQQFYAPPNATLREALGGSNWCWIREVYSDFVVVDDDDGHLFRVPWTEDPDRPGEVVFGMPSPVRVDYVDVPAPVAAAAGQPESDALRAGALRAAIAAHAVAHPKPDGDPPADPPATQPQAEPTRAPTDVPAAEPDNPPNQEDDMSLSAIRARLGLADDADEATVLAALDSRLQPTQPDDGTNTDSTDDGDEPVDDEPDAAQTRTPELVAAGKTRTALPPGVVAIEASMLAELKTKAEAGARAEARQRTEDRDRYIDAAIQAGKFAPARKDHWTRAYDADPDGTRQTIDGLAEGLVVPVAAKGHAGGNEEPDPYALTANEASGWARQLGISAEELAR